jgi:hypothetical protein
VTRTVLALMLLSTVAANAAELTCKRNPSLTGPCQKVTGSLGLTPGLGVTLMRLDGNRTLIKAPPDSNADIAPVVMQNWLYWQSKTGSIRTRITGSFELCPLPPTVNQAGIKDTACINSGSRISQDKGS